jgi:hypothetical protein
MDGMTNERQLEPGFPFVVPPSVSPQPARHDQQVALSLAGQSGGPIAEYLAENKGDFVLGLALTVFEVAIARNRESHEALALLAEAELQVVRQPHWKYLAFMIQAFFVVEGVLQFRFAQEALCDSNDLHIGAFSRVRLAVNTGLYPPCYRPLKRRHAAMLNIHWPEIDLP